MTKTAPAPHVRLDPEAKAFFDEHGYWLGPKLFEQRELDAIADAIDDVNHHRYETGEPPFDRCWEPGGGDPSAIRKQDNTHRSSATIRAACTNRTIGSIAAQLLGVETIRLWHDQTLWKPASGGKPAGNVAWHQDAHYWCSDRPNMITAWVPLHDVDERIGTMMFVDGSHRWGWKREFSHGMSTNLDEQRKVIEKHLPAGTRFRAVPCLLKAGHVSFHHCLTIHGSGPNLTDRPRKSLVAHLQAGDCRFLADTGDWHLCARQMLKLGKRHGDLFEGEYWPTLWPS